MYADDFKACLYYERMLERLRLEIDWKGTITAWISAQRYICNVLLQRGGNAKQHLSMIFPALQKLLVDFDAHSSPRLDAYSQKIQLLADALVEARNQKVHVTTLPLAGAKAWTSLATFEKFLVDAEASNGNTWSRDADCKQIYNLQLYVGDDESKPSVKPSIKPVER